MPLSSQQHNEKAVTGEQEILYHALILSLFLLVDDPCVAATDLFTWGGGGVQLYLKYSLFKRLMDKE